ncbi:MAG TPA: ABC transporter transmembrane domain-containing protein, partial [Coxiellaceae bacterium]|nr:ABC transporter transmembrane domain-containing protein [Coxiellaceae bacterium]
MFFIPTRRLLPMVLQSELSECALACLCMVFNFYGFRCSLRSLRRLFPSSLKGTSVFDIKKVSEYFGFGIKIYRLERDHLSSIAHPSILFWDTNHFVVLKKVKGPWFYLHNPARGIEKIHRDQLSNHFSRIALEIYPPVSLPDLSKEKTWSGIDFIRSIPGFKSGLAKMMLLSLGLQIAVLLSPQYIQRMIDGLSHAQNNTYFLLLLIYFFTLHSVECGLDYGRASLIQTFSYHLNKKMAFRLLAHLMHLPLSFFEKNSLGDMVSRFTSLEKIRTLVSTHFIETIINGLLAFITLLFLFHYQGFLALIVTVSCLLYSLVQLYLLPTQRQTIYQTIQYGAKHHSLLMESIRGMMTLKLFSKEKERIQQWEKEYDSYLISSRHFSQRNNQLAFLKRFLTGGELILIIYLGIFQIRHHRLSLGQLYAILFYRQIFTLAFYEWVEKLLEYGVIKTHINRLTDIFERVIEQDSSQIIDWNPPIIQLEAKKIGFSYDRSKFLFRSISFTLIPPQTLLIQAPSGTGKTTLFKCLMKLLPLSEGKILINGVSLQTIEVANYRKRLASVMQNDILFSGSVVDNIGFFDKKLDPVKVIRSAK